MVIDTSIIVSIVLAEPMASWAATQLDNAKSALKMSTVNLAEALIVVEYRKPNASASLQTLLVNTPLEFIAPSLQHAYIVAQARKAYPLNLGDCFAYALARTEGLPILTLDRDFRAIDVPVILPPQPTAH